MPNSPPLSSAFLSALSGAVARARRAHPEIRVSDAEFAAYVAARWPDDVPVMPEGLESIHIDDLYVACGCARGDPAALAVFEARCADVIAGAVQRIDGAEDRRTEAAQRTRTRLLVADAGAEPRIAQYSGRAPLASFVRVVATREAMSSVRRQRPPIARSEEVLAAMADGHDGPELAYLKQLYAVEFRAAFEAALLGLTDRQRSLLRYQIVDGLELSEIAEIYGRPRSTIGRHVLEARRDLIDATHAQLRHQLQVGRSVLESVLRLVQSSVDVSVRRLLVENDPQPDAR